MSKIIMDPKKINMLKSAIVIFAPDGKIISIEKIAGFSCHIQYLKILYKNNKEIKKLLSNIDLNYYIKNPADVLTDIIPIFAQNEYSVYLNMAPQVIAPTNMAMMLLPETLPKKTNTTLNNIREKLSLISFIDMGNYNPEINYFDSFFSDFSGEPNSEVLFELINNIKGQNSRKLKSK